MSMPSKAGYQSAPTENARRMGPAQRSLPSLGRDDVFKERLAPHPPALMTSLFFRALLHLVFKWRFDHLVGAVAGRDRILNEMTPCRFFHNILIPPGSMIGCATRKR